MRLYSIALSAALLFGGCVNSGNGRGTGGGNGDGGGGGGGGNIPNCDPTKNLPDDDKDHDGYTVNAGDCNDCNPSVNPGAIQIPNDPVDYACNGQPGVVPSCDTTNAGKNDPASLAAAFEQCDSRFFKSASLVGPSDPQARAVVPKFGSLMPQQGANMAILSTGKAVDASGPGFVAPQIGTNLGCGNEFANPLPNVPANPLCAAELNGMSCEPMTVTDYTELVVKLKAPTNVHSFTFQFHFMSAEYPDFVCTEFNDEFLVLMESQGEFQQPSNISFDEAGNPITVNNGLFSVCQNGSKSYDMNCKHPVSMLAGTGYDLPISMQSTSGGGASCQNDGMGPCGITLGGDKSGGSSTPQGGSTGWLTTTAPVTPGEDVTLHFIIFDEGDHIYDSAVLIDNFVWGTSVVNGPTTGPIG